MNFRRIIQSLWRDDAADRDGITEEPSEIRFRTWVLAIAMLAGPPLLFIMYSKGMFPGLTNRDALDFAQLGHNISQGRGFSTYILRPLALTHGDNPMMQPDVVHSPLYPFLLALAFAIAGAKDTVVAAVSGIFYLLTIPVLYILGVRLFNRAVALLTVLTFSVNALMLEYAASGTHLTLFIFLMTWLLLAVHNIAVYARNENRVKDATDRDVPQAKFPTGQFVLAGVLTSLLYLTDSLFFWIIPILVVTVFTLSGKNKIGALVAFGVPLLCLMGPWMYRNMMLTGNPIFGLRGLEVWMYTKGHYPSDSAYRHFSNELLPSVGLFQAVVQKIMLGAGEVIQLFPQITASWVLAFFLPCLLFRYNDSAIDVLRRVMMFCFLGLLVGSLAFQIQMWMFVAIIPVMLLYSVAYLLDLIRQAQLRPGAVAVVVSLLSIAVLYPLLWYTTLTDKVVGLKEVGAARALAKNTQKTDVILSDQPWIVAWYADRPSIWIPATDDRITDVRNRFNGARWLFVTDQVRGFSEEWAGVYQVLASRNTAYDRLGTEKKTWQAVRISSNGAPIPVPLLTALEGFTTVAPAADTTPSVVIASSADTNQNLGMLPTSDGSTNP
ncbi:MAG TPA: glycosyltransferase family 39 protein [Chthonomonadaceae bacterium]|nr:glycosyltransferase family 39 protein [Chthonomonadaceae bacterium]